MAAEFTNISQKTTDADRNSLADIKNTKNQKLLDAKRDQKAITDSGKDKKKQLPDIEHQITILENEVNILDRTIKIYDATYDGPWRTEKAEKLQQLWKELEGTFKSDKMRKLLDYLWSQLQQDTDHKHKGGKGQ
ncbi:hypothetical protein EG329_012871 [Mollisiaceae sp. DMI_Dod_QoI]|nr:hypothetical protein EG329_012871 [Helotiales sp. DMI_Dod_QoI]